MCEKVLGSRNKSGIFMLYRRRPRFSWFLVLVWPTLPSILTKKTQQTARVRWAFFPGLSRRSVCLHFETIWVSSLEILDRSLVSRSRTVGLLNCLLVCLLNSVFVQTVPVKTYAMSYAIRGCCITFHHLHGVSYVILQAKSMDLQIGFVRHRGQKVNL